MCLCDWDVVVGESDCNAANEDLHASLNKLCISMIGAALDSGANDPLWLVECYSFMLSLSLVSHVAELHAAVYT